MLFNLISSYFFQPVAIKTSGAYGLQMISLKMYPDNVHIGWTCTQLNGHNLFHFSDTPCTVL